MIKILNAYKWLEDENTKEIDECIEKGLLKYTDDESRPQFIVLESNLSAVKEILGEDYNKFQEKDFIEWLEFDFGGCYEDLTIENIFGDKIHIDIDKIIDMVSDEEVEWFTKDMKLEIFNAECPNDKVFEYLNDFGREQARNQIQDLLNSITTQQFR